ncbi:5,6-dimethylbenzimidazole synthase [Pacificibacter marinus]|uniref:5,6-dimethylbenzimidazole synthase n=1 Tax=Pacificibacter marinus TaxID=658057 RepID=A0A1Y5SAB2_9RHOB|nr:5,6-dimethylbenzimidazole synthase [Pacificibacter marinus]SEK76339.1 cob(II)yrinic acid a,c-diamide reductase [Pacificibacter marinus]SLN34553.1 5,6-dimethylbenzimidazole synthase [Pacificibacter marinus]
MKTTSRTGQFTRAFRDDFQMLMRLRRDVRHFRTDPVDPDLFATCLDSFSLAPSVGLSQPWQIVDVKSDKARAAVQANFETANAQALSGYTGDTAKLYAGLKLAGLREAPIHLAVFCDEASEKGKGLGAGTMPEMRRYSVVCAIMQFWLTLRTHGLGLGWVSILDAARLNDDLDIPKDWALVGYLCIGWPQTQTLDPELEQLGWEERLPCPLPEIR